jgi:NADH:ubiquinone oxidoreductase subunit E
MSKKNTPPKILYICTGEKCRSRGSKEISKTLREYTKDHGLEDTVGIIRTHCTDNCKHGPVVCLQPQNEWHFHVDDEKKALSLLKRSTLHSGEKHGAKE